ncbi:MAG: hypothetical protein ACYSWU_17955 [Planctomycetota bacterium]|jgi:hypothetical protein
MARIEVTQTAQRKSFVGRDGSNVPFIEFYGTVNGDGPMRISYFDGGRKNPGDFNAGNIVQCEVETKATEYGKEAKVMKGSVPQAEGTAHAPTQTNGGTQPQQARSAEGVDLDTAIGVMAAINRKLAGTAFNLHGDAGIEYKWFYEQCTRQATALWLAWMDRKLTFKKREVEHTTPEPPPPGDDDIPF